VMPTGTGYVHGGEDSSGNRSTQSRQGDTHDLVAARGLDQSHGYLLRKLQHREEFGFGDSERAVNAGLGVSADCAEEGCSDARGREWAKVKATNTICARNPIICEASTRTTMLVRCFTVRTVLISELPMSNSENGCSKYRQPSWNSKLDWVGIRSCEHDEANQYMRAHCRVLRMLSAECHFENDLVQFLEDFHSKKDNHWHRLHGLLSLSESNRSCQTFVSNYLIHFRHSLFRPFKRKYFPSFFRCHL